MEILTFSLTLNQLCDTFHLPMVYFADEPGFVTSLEQQRQGIVRAGAKMLCATFRTRSPGCRSSSGSFMVLPAYATIDRAECSSGWPGRPITGTR
jgi:hypothetical protein